MCFFTFYSCTFEIVPFFTWAKMSATHESGSVTTRNNDEKKTPFHAETEVASEAERDAQALARLGKKPILKVCSTHRTANWDIRGRMTLMLNSDAFPSCPYSASPARS